MITDFLETISIKNSCGYIQKYLPINIQVLHEDAIIPKYGSHGAACFDFYSIESNDIYPGKGVIFKTGLAVEIPEGHVLLIFSRSGHGFNYDTRLSNATGVIDSDYRGEIMIKLHCDGDRVLHIERGDRIAQGIVIPYLPVGFEIVSSLSKTSRGSGGFGSTGT